MEWIDLKKSNNHLKVKRATYSIREKVYPEWMCIRSIQLCGKKTRYHWWRMTRYHWWRILSRRFRDQLGDPCSCLGIYYFTGLNLHVFYLIRNDGWIFFILNHKLNHPVLGVIVFFSTSTEITFLRNFRNGIFFVNQIFANYSAIQRL